MVLVCKTIIINQNGMDPLCIKLDRCFSLSKLCNNFGIKNTTLKLSNTRWTLAVVVSNILHNRDINVALNLKAYYYKEIKTKADCRLKHSFL
ncbi:conserved hypothetical protein (plasmid) [Borreliella garinii PBr]|uniref:Uncharacterized protein n=1 Tax=Borreliella garinii PBr TaxID=498743 RepID=B8F0Z0_BORGR|nr:conserved hypothetical protein [Borreliella garinii PBr]